MGVHPGGKGIIRSSRRGVDHACRCLTLGSAGTGESEDKGARPWRPLSPYNHHARTHEPMDRSSLLPTALVLFAALLAWALADPGLAVASLFAVPVGIVGARRSRREQRRAEYQASQMGYMQRAHKHDFERQIDPDPDACGCSGNGWISTTCDTWEKCPHHYDGQTCPENRVSEREMRERQKEMEARWRKSRIEDPKAAHKAALKKKENRESSSEESSDERSGGDELPEGHEDPLPF